MIKKATLLILLLISILDANSQTGISMPLKQEELNRVLNSTFNKLVTSNPNPGEIANYASLDPINASFSVKSTLPVQPGRKRKLKALSFENKLLYAPSRISYLSFSASGNLIDKNYGVLFSNSSLNSGVSLQAQYNFKIKDPHFSFFNDEWNDFAVKRDLLFKTYNNNLVEVQKKMNIVAIQQNRSLLELKQLSNQAKLKKSQVALDLAKKTIDSLGIGIKDRPGLADTLQTLVKDNTAILTDINQTSYTMDSLDLITPAIDGHAGLKIEGLRKKLKSDYDTLASKLQLQRISVTWFTILGGYSRKSYNTFNASLPFSSQIGKGKLDAFNFGIAINHLYQNRIKNRTWFLNASVSRLRNNNLVSLSTSTIDQVNKITNAAGDTVRTITNKHIVYTSPVKTFMLWNLSGHIYYLFGKTPSGFHILPSVDFQSDGLTVMNFTAGYIISFKNTAKDQPVINSELYVRFNDITDTGEKGNNFLKRNEIGISFTVPFNIF